MSKKLVGGVFLLCLTAMTLTLSEDGETYTNITQPEILEQLTNLKNYVSNPKMIKPVWVQLKNGDEIVVVQGELKVVDTGEFEICVQLNGYKLVISIEFTQATLEDDTPIDDWYIAENDAKYLFTSDAQNIGAILSTGEIDNAKPIYIHPILIVQPSQSATEYYSFSIFIFDNNENAYDDFTKLVNALYSIFDKLPAGSTARFPCSGSILNSDGKYQINSTLEVNAKALSNIQVIGVQADGLGTNLTRRDFNGIQNCRVFDGVNKIN